MARHDLPSGGWVELRDAMLRGRDQKRIMRGMKPDSNGGLNQMDVGLSINDGVIAALVADWKLPYDPEPADDGTPREWVLPAVDVAIIDDLSMADYNALCLLVQPAKAAAFPDKPDPTDHADPQSPTGPANA